MIRVGRSGDCAGPGSCCPWCSGLQEQAGWQSRLFQAIVAWSERLEVWALWEEIYSDWENPNRKADAQAFYQSQRAEMDRGASVLWPERESLYHLFCKRANLGHAAFAAEKQGDPVDPEVCEWQKSAAPSMIPPRKEPDMIRLVPP